MFCWAFGLAVCGVADACELLSLKRRQVFRLMAGLEHGGVASLVSKSRGRPGRCASPLATHDTEGSNQPWTLVIAG
jgi:hypothetical protein